MYKPMPRAPMLKPWSLNFRPPVKRLLFNRHKSTDEHCIGFAPAGMQANLSPRKWLQSWLMHLRCQSHGLAGIANL